MRLVDRGLEALIAQPAADAGVALGAVAGLAALAAVTKAWGTPPVTRKALAELEATVRGLPAKDRAPAEKMTPAGLFQCLHGMRRWYKGRTSMRKVLVHKKALAQAMSTKAPVGAFRGFKVSKDDPMAKRKVGDVVTLGPSLREDGKERSHGHVSSWTWKRHVADRFSGASKGKVGIVVKCVDKRAHTLVAPPKQSKAWFNHHSQPTISTTPSPVPWCVARWPQQLHRRRARAGIGAMPRSPNAEPTLMRIASARAARGGAVRGAAERCLAAGRPSGAA